MLDYHVHLWPHPLVADETELAVERLATYCEAATAAGVSEIALTEHYHRFRQGRKVVEGFWNSDPNAALRADMAHYFDHHATADLDRYVETALAAKRAGLPVVVGLEVDYYRGQMDDVARLLAGYPFDVLLGSVHWLGLWMFDVVGSPVQMGEWERRGTDAAWRTYGEAIEELAGTGACDVLAHPDVVKVTGRFADPGLVTEVEERICAAAVSSGMAAELSSAGFRKPVGQAYPSQSLLRRFSEQGVPLTTASDTHGPTHVADRTVELHELARAAGFSALRAFRGRRGHDIPLVAPVAKPGAPVGEVGESDLTDSKSVP